jgi:hypothetical protein
MFGKPVPVNRAINALGASEFILKPVSQLMASRGHDLF